MSVRVFGLITSLTVLALGPAAEAASLEVLKGVILVNQGGGYVPAASGEVKTGDSLLAKEGGQGRVVFADGCTVTLDAGNSLIVNDSSPCAQAADRGWSTTTEETAGFGGAAPYLIGAAVVGGVIALASGGGSSGSGSGGGGGGGGGPGSP